MEFVAKNVRRALHSSIFNAETQRFVKNVNYEDQEVITVLPLIL